MLEGSGRGRQSLLLLPRHRVGDHTRCAPASCLSAREARIQALVGEGLTPRQLGIRLGVTPEIIRRSLRRGKREGWL